MLIGILPFSEPPVIVDLPTSYTFNEASAAELVCNASGSPSPNITWLFEGRDLASNSSSYVINSFVENGYAIGRLAFLSINRNASGVYTCAVSNGLGRDDERNTTVLVFSK